jgi:hypothetical protein
MTFVVARFNRQTKNSKYMLVSDLKPFECVQLVEGTGDSIMHVIKGQNEEIFVTRDNDIRRLSANESNETNQWVYNQFSKEKGIKDNTLDVVEKIQKTSRDWYVMLLCEIIIKGIKS